MSKVYFNHTTKQRLVKMGLVPATTIALKREGKEFHYGVSMCSRGDNFNKEQGRKIAETRMEQGFRRTTIPADLLALEEQIGEKGMCLAFLYVLTESLVVNSRRWKKRITRHNMELNETAKVVSLKTKKELENQPA